jgi:hypothetical protein
MYFCVPGLDDDIDVVLPPGADVEDLTLPPPLPTARFTSRSFVRLLSITASHARLLLLFGPTPPDDSADVDGGGDDMISPCDTADATAAA